MKKFEVLNNYIRVLRLHRTINFTFMLFGALYANQFVVNESIIIKVFFVYITFGIFLYGGIYSFNGYYESSEDSVNPSMKQRMIPSKKTQPSIVLLNSFIFILFSLVLGLLFLKELFLFQIYLLIINIFYTVFLKRINSYLAILVIATTGPVKFLIGYLLLQDIIIINVLFIMITHYLCSVAYHLRKFVYNNRLSREDEKTIIPAIYLLVIIITSLNSIFGNFLVLIIVIPALFESARYYFDKKYSIIVQNNWNRE